MSEPHVIHDVEGGPSRARGERGVIDPERDPTILRSLQEFTHSHPHDRKLLVTPDVNLGRELLLTLARRTGGWVGWEAVTLRSLAAQLAFLSLADRAVRPAHDVEIGLLVNRALTLALEAGEVGSAYRALARSLGFQRSLKDALMELRTAGVTASALRGAARPGSPASDLAAVMVRYEGELREESLADPAGIFHAALEAFDDEAGFTLDARIALLPTLRRRGLPRALLDRLLARGAIVLLADTPGGTRTPGIFAGAGAPLPADLPRSPLAWASADRMPEADESAPRTGMVGVDFFSAATPDNEIREVLRRALSEGIPWDDVEIVATDPDTYGIALDALCQRLGIGATMLGGVPLARTRVGRALDRWFTWIGDGLPADTLREALEAGDLAVPGSDLPPSALARELRALGIGWGRARYDAARARIESGDRSRAIVRHDDEGDEEFAERVAARDRAARGVAALLGALLSSLPDVPERGDERVVPGSCARLATATLSFLDLVPLHGHAEQRTVQRLRDRLERLATQHDEESGFGSALAALREALADVRAWPMQTNDRKPWSASGGMPHLTDITHGGATGRRRVFVVGLDAGRTAGVGRQDPLLPDTVRRDVAPGALATTAERREEGAFLLGGMLATLRGQVTLSHAVRGEVDGREEGPSPVLLQAWRLVRNLPAATYDGLRNELRPPASPVPAPSRAASGALDARDTWLAAIGAGALLLDASQQVRTAFPGLDRGLAALSRSQGGVLAAEHGHLPMAGALLDLLQGNPRPVSPSALERVARCPLSWFYRDALRLRPPRDPEFDVTRWLDSAQRGSLLHEIYERFTREYVGRQDALDADEVQARLLTMADEIVAQWREQVPPPGEAAFAQERGEILRSARAFLALERSRRDGARWRDFEYEFGFRSAPGRYELPRGQALAIRGRVDRIDELPHHSLRIVDYKTGRARRFAKVARDGPFGGGRQLQPALYAAAVEALEGRVVSSFEYVFPTERGENAVVAYSAEELREATPIIQSLVDDIRAGHFLPTDAEDDCRYCDVAAICRVRIEAFGKVVSPRAAWAKDHGERLFEYAGMRRRRGSGGGEGDA